MCGICGIITNKSDKKKIRAFKSLLIANEARGDHSTGILTDRKVYKAALSSSQYVDMIPERNLLSKYLLGHTRFATTGKISKENSHPFTYGGITGIHNGIIDNWKDINNTVQVDSEVIFYLLNKYDNDYIKAFSEIEGSACIAWRYKDNIHLVKHDNPLAIAITDDGIYFSSEFYALYTTLYALNIPFQSIEEIESDTVYTIHKDLTIEKDKVSFKDREYGGKYKGSYSDSYYDNLYEDIYDKPESMTEMFLTLMEDEGCYSCAEYDIEGYLDYDSANAYCKSCGEMTKREHKNIDLIYIKDAFIGDSIDN